MPLLRRVLELCMSRTPVAHGSDNGDAGIQAQGKSHSRVHVAW